jgi:DNA-directed RNA polymerase III subunit RPC3
MFRELVLFTKLKLRAIRAALLVLTQHGILWHSVVDGEEMYELSIDNCLMRLRFGKFLVIAGQLFGEEVGVWWALRIVRYSISWFA